MLQELFPVLTRSVLGTVGDQNLFEVWFVCSTYSIPVFRNSSSCINHQLISVSETESNTARTAVTLYMACSTLFIIVLN